MKNNHKKFETSPEERARIVKAVEDKLAIGKSAPSELEQIAVRKNLAKDKVTALMKPIIDLALMESQFSPNYAHSDSGRARLLVQAHKFYIDELRTLSKEEALFMLAFAYAERTIEDFL